MERSDARFLHCITTRDLYLTYNTERVGKLGYYRDGSRYTGPKERFVWMVFKYFISLVLDDIIRNGVEFQLGTYRGINGFMVVDRISDEEYRYGKRMGAFSEFDESAIGMMAYQIRLHMSSKKRGEYKRRVNLSKENKYLLADIVNAGKLKIGKIKKYDDYMDALVERFTNTTRKVILGIVHHGLQRILTCTDFGCDIRIKGEHSLIMQTGNIYENIRMMKRYVMLKLKARIRQMYVKLMCVWDGVWYFSLEGKSKYEKAKSDLENGGEVDFGPVILYKCKDEAYASALGRNGIFSVTGIESDNKFTLGMSRLITNKAKLDEEIATWHFKSMEYRNRKYETLFPDSVDLKKMRSENIKRVKEMRLREND